MGFERHSSEPQSETPFGAARPRTKSPVLPTEHEHPNLNPRLSILAERFHFTISPAKREFMNTPQIASGDERLNMVIARRCNVAGL